jgi:hypothetical protein
VDGGASLRAARDHRSDTLLRYHRFDVVEHGVRHPPRMAGKSKHGIRNPVVRASKDLLAVRSMLSRILTLPIRHLIERVDRPGERFFPAEKRP